MGHIYKILNKTNGKFYLGSTCMIEERWKDHVYELKTGKKIEINPHLQNAWDKYGEDSFALEIVEETNDDILFEREQFYLDLLMSWDNEIGYNIAKSVFSPLKGRKMSLESKLKLSLSLKGKIRTPEHQRKLTLSQIGKKRSDETKKKISLNRKGKYCGEKNHKFGIRMPGEKNPTSKLTNKEANEIREKYNNKELNQCELATLYNVCQTTISNIILHKCYNDKE